MKTYFIRTGKNMPSSASCAMMLSGLTRFGVAGHAVLVEVSPWRWEFLT